MKLIMKYVNGKPVTIDRHWGDHWPACAKCREVNIEKSATLANACAEGAPLLMEELTKRQAPVVREKAKEVREWAKQAGVFKIK